MWYYYVTQVIPPKAAKVWMGTMFTYGFTRTYRSEYPMCMNQSAWKCGWSTFRGLVYTFPPLGAYALLETAGRSIVGPEKMPYLYTDGLTVNRRVWV